MESLSPEIMTADRILASLRDAGCRITQQRVAVVGYLAERNDHPSVRQIHSALSNGTSGPSLAMVYNTLATLVDLGLVREMEFEAADNRYDTNLAPHMNLVCTVCGAIIDVDQRLPVSPDVIRQSHGFEILDLRVEGRGVCAKCRTKGKEAPHEF